MKLKIDFKKIIAAFMLIMVIGTAFIGNLNTVYGKINEEYSVNDKITYIDVEKAADDSNVLNAVASFIYTISGYIEKIVAYLMGMFTGTEMFPWADTVVFNSVRFLDINFLSPSIGSMFRNNTGTTTFGMIIKNLYNTLFTLSITFFGVVVGVMALKLAMSSIASEKAKYKQAITNWLLALIMLFTAHYLISFIFFVNEKMVEVASSILKDTSEKQGSELYIDTSVLTSEARAKIFKNVFLGAWETKTNVSIPLQAKGQIDGYFLTLRCDGGKISILPIKISGYDFKNWNFQNATAISGVEMDDETKKSFISNFMALVFNKEYMEYRQELDDYEGKAYDKLVSYYGEDFNEFDWSTILIETAINPPIFDVAGKIADWVSFITGGKERDLQRLCMDALAITYSDESTMNKVIQNIQTNIPNSNDLKALSSETYINKYYNFQVANNYNGSSNYPGVMESIFNNISNSNSSSKSGNVFTGLGQFFKNSVYSYRFDNEGNVVGFTATKFNPIPAILYSIFVIQSIMYFIAYLKRFFYIIVLALFAPLVIVYDFLTKTTMG